MLGDLISDTILCILPVVSIDMARSTDSHMRLFRSSNSSSHCRYPSQILWVFDDSHCARSVHMIGNQEGLESPYSSIITT